jgi:uncharacterized protein (DUF2164 family)
MEKEQKVKFTPEIAEKITKSLVPTLTKLGPDYLETKKALLTKELVSSLKHGQTYASRIFGNFAIATKELEHIANNIGKVHQPQALKDSSKKIESAINSIEQGKHMLAPKLLSEVKNIPLHSWKVPDQPQANAGSVQLSSHRRASKPQGHGR